MFKVYSFINFSRTIAYNFVIWPFCGTNILHAENDLNTLHATAKIKSLFIGLQLSNHDIPVLENGLSSYLHLDFFF